MLLIYADLTLGNEEEIEKVEEKTNQLLTSLDMWTKTEQVGLVVQHDPYVGQVFVKFPYPYMYLLQL